MLSLHTAPTTQTLSLLRLPQPPQLLGSLVGFTQTPLQAISGLGQLATQVDPLQTSPIEVQLSAGVAALQPPQFTESLVKLVQIAPLWTVALVLLAGQTLGSVPVQPQTPLVQVAPTAHWMPQPPQLLGSLFSFTHVVPQATSGSGHDSTHFPTLQKKPSEQPKSQLPQLLRSVLRLVQAPSLGQNCSGKAPQVHAPALQNSPPLQALPHEPASSGPQFWLLTSGFTQLLPH